MMSSGSAAGLRRKMLVLTYHSHHVVADEYEFNDHIAFARDLELLNAAGVEIVSLSSFVNAWTNAVRDSRGVQDSAPLVALTFDDGPIYDVADFVHPEFGHQRSFLNAMREFRARHGAAVQPGLHATSFVIASPEARRLMETTFDAEYTYLDAGSMNDTWWSPAIDTGFIGIANHSWDHVHPAVPAVARPRAVRADFRQVMTIGDADAQISTAARFIAAKTNDRALPFFAYPFGHYNDFLVDQYLPHLAEPRVRAAFSAEPRPLARNDSPWCLPRYVCGHNWKASEQLFEILL